jgi:hypothetical protein
MRKNHNDLEEQIDDVIRKFRDYQGGKIDLISKLENIENESRNLAIFYTNLVDDNEEATKNDNTTIVLANTRQIKGWGEEMERGSKMISSIRDMCDVTHSDQVWARNWRSDRVVSAGFSKRVFLPLAVTAGLMIASAVLN